MSANTIFPVVITISKRTLRFLTRLAEREYPRESCAVLLGRKCGEVNVAVACANVHPEPLRHYAIDPRELIRLQHVARSFELQIVGFHHSHPDHDAVPSETDVAEAEWAGCVYVITSVRNSAVDEARAFLLSEEAEKSFREVKLELLGSSSF